MDPSIKLTKIKNIAVSGDISTGKSTLARNLAQVLGWKYLSGGEYIRKWFKDHNLNVNDADLVPEEVDKQLDFGYQEKMKNEPNIIFESHLAGWLAKDLPSTFKVLCLADYDTRMKRASMRDKVSIEEANLNAKKRAGLLIGKFKKLYGVEDSFEPQFFDLVVDTTTLTPQEVLDTVLKELLKRGVILEENITATI